VTVYRKDIAKKLNISPATVTLVLNNKPGISEEIRQRVFETAEEMGYDYQQKKNVSRQSYNIQFAIYKKYGYKVFDSPILPQLLEGVMERIKEDQCSCEFVYFETMSDGDTQWRSLRDSKSDGIILLATEMQEEDMEYFEQLTKPVVYLDNFFLSSKNDFISMNNQQGGYLATRYLLDMGHTNIGFIHSVMPMNNISQRYEGFVKAVQSSQEAAGSAGNVFKISYNTSQAYKDMMQLIKSNTGMPSAFLIGSDLTAIACMRALNDSGYSVPGDVSVVSFDNIPMGKIIRPTLTTINMHPQRMGKLAVERLFNVMNGETSEKITLTVACDLVERESVATYRAKK